MYREDKFITDTFGRKQPFKVPEGYFDDFASRLMESLPEQSEETTARVVALKPSRHKRLRPIVVAAAGVIAAVFSVGVYLHTEGSHSPAPASQATAQTKVSHAYTAVDAMADYTMLDTDDMYAYMADAE